MKNEREDAVAGALRDLEGWDVSVTPHLLELIVHFRKLISSVRDCGFSVASCFFCVIANPKLSTAKCPSCETLVRPDGRRCMQKPAICGLTIPDKGFTREEAPAVVAKIFEKLQVIQAEALSRQPDPVKTN